jgi:aerobic carbon-monoxide dehydrogenase large subunit
MTKAGSGAKWHPRVEDDALVRGLGRFAADALEPGQGIGYFVRSPHASARIRSIDVVSARSAPGVIGVLTAEDMKVAGVSNTVLVLPLTDRHGKPMFIPARPSLAAERVLHVGQPIALIVADTLAHAQDAAELVSIEFEELPAVVDARDAVKSGAPQLWPDAPNNIAIDWIGPEPDGASHHKEVERIFSGAHCVARVELVNQRICGVTMEPRGATASYDAAADRYTLRSSTQGVGALRDSLTKILGIDAQKMRVIADDVGGGFGLKTPPYPEYPALLVAAMKLGRPVHWMSSRAESFESDNHARDAHTEAELALDREGRFLAMRVRHTVSMGAFLAAVGPQIGVVSFTRCLPGMYAIPAIALEARCVFTNTVPTGPYRGAGRPEANYVMERLVEEASRVSGIDRVELRRKNLIPKAAMPYKTPVGNVYDSGDFEPILDRALELSEYAGFPKRRSDAKRRGRLLGIGVSCFLEHSGALPVEGAAIVFDPGGTLEFRLNVHSTGQGHATVFARLIAERLGIDASHVRHRHGDSDFAIPGYASVGSRSAMTAGHALVRATDTVIAKGKKIAAVVLEADEAKIDYRNGAFEVSGTNLRIPLFDLAEKARELLARGAIAEGLDSLVKAETPLTFPNGCHIAEIEVDPETGKVAVVRYTAVDDCGNVLDHTIVEGQVQGGVVQGLGQALLEQTVYDRETGQLLTGSFMDYAMPHADEAPDVVGDVHPVAATTNPLGVKGVGEAGTTASPAAVMNAIADAIPGPAGAKMDMPATPEKVWRACREMAPAKA